jgi:hypothetical protein
MQIKYEGLITKEEFDKAIRIYYDQELRIWKFVCASIILLFIIAFLLQFFNILILSSPSSMVEMFIFILLLTFPWWVPLVNKNKNQYSTNEYRYPISGEITEQNLIMNSKNIRSTVQWDGIKKYTKEDDILMLFFQKRAFSILTKSLFYSEEDWNQFINFLKTKY